MSLADINPESVLAAIRAGHHTRADLAEHFQVLPTSLHLEDAIDALKADPPRIVEHPNKHLHPADLDEFLPNHNEEA
ncbi:hypothetical protein GCM10010172_07420 [Paractinoplanes ferrugineus]|uniref:Uncharacterized protein n=1 Tax=Paractinoplanes ferrugineus TaxID=113564 RepID=A0A919JBQ1_9ACTN|nr:hypothetical protein [Actinoplanes ferrugineus]GIE16887.1 hypothetical protein Afe05nite_87270 [Actinoplanes ferrugineus]